MGRGANALYSSEAVMAAVPNASGLINGDKANGACIVAGLAGVGIRSDNDDVEVRAAVMLPYLGTLQPVRPFASVT